MEIELGDWKDNRVFRLMAVDQGEMIFHDTIFDKSKTFMLRKVVIEGMACQLPSS